MCERNGALRPLALASVPRPHRSISGQPRSMTMEYRRLGLSGLTVPALSLGTGTFGGVGRLAAWGTTDAVEARRLVDICLDAGVSMFDSANVYSMGESERVLGEAIKGRRDKVLISTKASFRLGNGPN